MNMDGVMGGVRLDSVGSDCHQWNEAVDSHANGGSEEIDEVNGYEAGLGDA